MLLKCALLSILHLVTVSGQFNRRAISVDKKTARLSPSNVDGGGMNYAGYAVKSIIDSMEDDLHDRSFKDNKDPLMENTMRDNPDYVLGNSELEGHDGPSFKPMVSAVDSVNYLEDDHHDHSSEDNKDLLWKNTMEDHREDLFGLTDLTLVEDDHGESSVEDNLVLKDEMDIQSASQNRKLRPKLKSEKKVKDGKNTKESKRKKSKSNRSESEDEVTQDPTPSPISDTGGDKTIHVVTHAMTGDGNTNNVDSFWSTWKQGAELALGGRSSHTLKWHAVGYDATAATEALAEACSSGDAVVVTVPYASSTTEYEEMDEAINKCIEKGKPVFTANTDTYHNDDVYAFFGSSNYEMGEKCALAVLFPEDVDVTNGRKDAPRFSENSNEIQIYWDAVSKKDEGLNQRLKGMLKTFRKHFREVTVFRPTGQKGCPCATEYPDGVYDQLGKGKGLRVTISTIDPPGNVFQYPPRYGLDSCGRHDLNMIPSCNVMEPDDFCFGSWCYVDENNCDDETIFDREGQYLWTDFPGQEYPYSYKTCGETNQYLDFLGVASDVGDVVGLTNDKTQTIVLSSDWAPKFDSKNSNIFICGEEAVSMKNIPQFGQSPFLQGLSSVSAAAAAAIAIEKEISWNAYKGNAAATSSSEVYHPAKGEPTNEILTKPLSRYGLHIVKMLDYFAVERGVTWDIWHDAVFEGDWILQHPPQQYIGKPSADLPVPECCVDPKNDEVRPHELECNSNYTKSCELDFGLYTCVSDEDCEPKKLCRSSDGTGPKFQSPDPNERLCDRESYFAPGLCREVSSTQRSLSDLPKKMCVGHSHELYERMYKLIIEAEHLVEITSLDSFDFVGTLDSSASPFLSAIRNALTYLANTGKEIIVKCHFGSVAGLSQANEDTEKILKAITRDFDSDGKVTVYVGTYRYSIDSWNHGKIIVVDGKKLITGGSNYYRKHYLREDPIHDVSIQVSGGPAITAHQYSKTLWRTACDWFLAGVGGDLLDQLANLIDKDNPASLVDVAARQPDGEIQNSVLNSCPPDYNSLVANDILDKTPSDNDRPKTGASVIPAARLAKLGENIPGGSHTSDIAILAMLEEATETIKFSQQDMLPYLLNDDFPQVELLGYLFGAGYTFTGKITGTGFEDTWRLIGGIAKAISRRVNVHMMVSAPCAFAGDDASTFDDYARPCPGQGVGFDYWNEAYTSLVNEGFNRWPEAREEDEEWGHILDGEPFSRRKQPGEYIIECINEQIGNVRRELAYGYGWSLENIADWIFAYYMIVKDTRPKKTTEGGEEIEMNANEIVDLICEYAHIGHIRLTAEEETYKRGEYAGGQVGNHAKVVIVDDKIFYVGSDNSYGSGLAEFGLITDDADVTAEFNSNYWEPLWNQAVGTKEDQGLVSGSSRLDGTCPWRDNLGPGRPVPWNDVRHSMCRTYTNGDQCLESECHWVDKVLPHFQCDLGPHANSCYPETEYCTGPGTLAQLGEFCLEDVTCESQYCTFGAECAEKLDPGEGCVEHDDCKDGFCPVFYCDGSPKKNGERCFSDTGCESQRCSFPGFLCESKLNNGDTCLLDDDCISPTCTNTLVCGVRPDGDFCITDGDCFGDFCNWKTTCGEMANGNGCFLDTDCVSNRCDNSFTCNDKLLDGDSCYLSNNCQTGLCNNMFSCGRRSDGSNCLVDNDCTKGNCNGVFSCGTLNNGNICISDSDCTSDRCGWSFSCQSKLNNDERCWNNGDCKNGRCSLYWSGYYCD